MWVNLEAGPHPGPGMTAAPAGTQMQPVTYPEQEACGQTTPGPRLSWSCERVRVCCLKPLRLQIICYMLIDNEYNHVLFPNKLLKDITVSCTILAGCFMYLKFIKDLLIFKYRIFYCVRNKIRRNYTDLKYYSKLSPNSTLFSL